MLKIFDTTLRDGTQGQGVSFSVADKIKVALKLDEIGIDYVEGGWPGSNPKDVEFFKEAKSLILRRAKLVAFGSTRRAFIKPEEDQNLNAIVGAGVRVAAIFGKSWDFHVTEALEVPLEENLEMIYDSVRYLKSKGLEVIYDAEHFFDAYKANPQYALNTLSAAEKGGADIISLCDTNGGTMPWEVETIIGAVQKVISTPLGIHAHNDCEMGVANSLAAVRKGVVLIQGTINGYGERCGNANLCSILPNLQFKLGKEYYHQDNMEKLTETARYISELANLSPQERQPFVGSYAFAHKGGIHVSALLKNPQTYEHIEPELVGNRRQVLISELAGGSNILFKAQEMNIELEKGSKEMKDVLNKVKELEHQGYQFEDAQASFELMLRKTIKEMAPLFELEGFRVINEKREDGRLLSEATIKVRVGGKEVHTAASGDGPVNALDNALRKALEGFYQEIRSMRLVDYKVRVLNGDAGTEAKVRVTIQTSNGHDTWSTVGVSTNVIEASWQALVDSIEYGLFLEGKNREVAM